MSFAKGAESAFDHIRQYAGPADDQLAAQLFDTLERMKADCSYPPLLPLPIGRTLEGARLERHRDSWSGDYFLALGELPPGHYRLVLGFDGGGRVRVELIDATFDPLVDRCFDLADERLSVTLELPGPTGHYLRIRLRGPVQVRSLVFAQAP